jgi:hypothetical protein
MAVAAGLAGFGAHAAALLVALVAALAWALWGMAATRAALDERGGNPELRLAARLRAGVMQFLDAHGAEAHRVRGQLEQLRILLGDAAGRLGASFAAMHALAARQREIARAIASAGGIRVRAQAAANDDTGAQSDVRPEPAAGPEAEAVADELGAVTRELQRTVHEAVTALQFQDIAAQLLGYTAERVDALDRMAGKLERLPNASADELGKALASAQSGRRDNPVSQAQMAHGTVELF